MSALDDYNERGGYRDGVWDPNAAKRTQHAGWRGRAVYDQDERWARSPMTVTLLQWEHELDRPATEYYDYFLEAVTR